MVNELLISTGSIWFFINIFTKRKIIIHLSHQISIIILLILKTNNSRRNAEKFISHLNLPLERLNKVDGFI